MKDMAATANGVYGFKVLPSQFERALPTGVLDELPKLSFIHLRRQDLVGQAISFVRAVQTSQWNSVSGRQNEPNYNRRAISDRLVALAKNEARWRYYFARTGLKPLHMIYEEVAADPQAAVAAVADLVGLSPAPVLAPDLVELDIQRDALNESWRARFLAEARNLAVFHKLWGP